MKITQNKIITSLLFTFLICIPAFAEDPGFGFDEDPGAAPIDLPIPWIILGMVAIMFYFFNKRKQKA